MTEDELSLKGLQDIVTSELSDVYGNLCHLGHFPRTAPIENPFWNCAIQVDKVTQHEDGRITISGPIVDNEGNQITVNCTRPNTQGVITGLPKNDD